MGLSLSTIVLVYLLLYVRAPPPKKKIKKFKKAEVIFAKMKKTMFY